MFRLERWLVLIVLCLAGCIPDTATIVPGDDDVNMPPTDTAVPGSTTLPAPTLTEQPASSPTFTAATAESRSNGGFLLADAGFATPESILHDPAADVYLVSNINGAPGEQDANGFVSRVSPEGVLLDLKWLDGSTEDVTLHAPKGLALTDTELWIADITALRIFDRVTGAPLGEVPITGASFLNDVAVAPDGAVWVTDSGSGALYRVAPDRSAEQVTIVPGINGIAFFNEIPWVTGGDVVLSIETDGTTIERANVPSGGLDGLVILRNGALVVSSWGTSSVYTIGMGEIRELVGGINGPADIGFDERRLYVLIPHFRDNAVQAVPLP